MKKGRVLVVIIGAVILGNSLFIPTEEVHFFWEKFFLSSALIGFIGSLLLIVLTKIVIKHVIQRDEGYYD